MKVENINRKENQKSNREIFRGFIVIFLIGMGLCTLFAQKITHIMTPKVEVAYLKSGELKSNPGDPASESLGHHSM